jgi:hypothetical protein
MHHTINKSNPCTGSTRTTATIILVTIITTTRGTKLVHSLLTLLNLIIFWEGVKF